MTWIFFFYFSVFFFFILHSNVKCVVSLESPVAPWGPLMVLEWKAPTLFYMSAV